VYVKIRIYGFYYSDETLFYHQGRKYAKRIEMLDSYANPIFIKVRGYNMRVSGARTFYFCTPACIINETPMQLLYYRTDKKNKHQQILPGQLGVGESPINIRVLPVSEQYFIKIGLAKKNQNLSEVFDMKAIDQTNLKIKGVKQGKHTPLYVLGVRSHLQTIDQNRYLYTKVITISPRYVLVNKTKKILEVR
jgi:vacuolar protein sorting-associated protein 13A/C